MARYIDKDEFAVKFDRECRGECCCCKYATLTQSGCEIIDDFPCADVQEVRRGRWLIINGCAYCSNCRNNFKKAIMSKARYCPNCGARMEE